MNRKERIELLIQAYEDNLVGYESLRTDFERKISELGDAIRELRCRRTNAENEIKALNLLLSDPDGNISALESHEAKRMHTLGWFTTKVLRGERL